MIKIDGIDSIIAALDDISDMSGIDGAVGKACALVEGAAKKKAPKKTGELRRSIESKVERTTDSIVGTVYTALEYAPYVEFGTGLFAEKGGRKDVPWAYRDEKTGELIFTRGQKPQPYLRPAFNENRKEILRMIKEGMNK